MHQLEWQGGDVIGDIRSSLDGIFDIDAEHLAYPRMS